jgi:hypothetical protein
MRAAEKAHRVRHDARSRKTGREYPVTEQRGILNIQENKNANSYTRFTE